ncbi:hypothetical protein M758_7G036700 [Ceratodon purpureus]|uniref:LIM zinc-binding domain-containing protein n=2 Tax=Ceratodon purpureus TaxID=3225 RepID=A0A8T0H2I7_CERPU|nr:hypothetical protein KC19_7G038200 [Ceratodon purpureus]KAG0610068.1 hypothetical protein M758_7G036700 [Ceratodon purpureus]
MAWIADKLFGSSGSASYKYTEGDEYPDYTNIPRRTTSDGWTGPNIFQDPRRDEGSSYYYPDNRTSYPTDQPAYNSHHGSAYEIDERPPSNTNDRPIYNNERVSYPQDAIATDRAIALALAEEEKRRNPPPDTSADEELARALQASLDLQYRPQRPMGRPPSQKPSATGGCAGCKQPLGYGRFLSCLGKNWHPDCFVCKMCSKPIADREFSVQGGDAYHRDCYKELFHPKCEVCTQFIPTNAAGLIEYRSHPFWNQKYCPRHERDGTPRCCSCDRIQTAEVQYPALEDGRKLCLECLETAVVDTKECQPLYRDILKFYKHVGMMIDQEVPMLLVARDALNEAREGEKEGMHTSETRGLCLSEEQTITTVFGGKSRGRNPFPSIWTEPHKLVRHCEVTAILVLYGLPRLLTGSILAHELMHAWLRLEGGFPHMRPEVEEGICQVMSHIWLSAELRRAENKASTSQKGVNTPAQAKLGQFYLHQIATDSSPIYGDGFRRGLAAVNQFGLSRVLEHLRLTANFP